MTLGELTMIELIAVDMKCDATAEMLNGLEPMHCAAQTYPGLLSILFMNQRLGIDVNTKDSRSVTPLHFAVLFK